MINLIEFQISVQDDQSTDDTMIDFLAHLAMDLERQNAVVTSAQLPSQAGKVGCFSQEDRSSSLLNIEVNRDNWQTCSQWLYERLVGTTTKVRFEHEDLEFAFQERDHHDQQLAHKEFEVLVNWMETSRKVLNAA